MAETLSNRSAALYELERYRGGSREFRQRAGVAARFCRGVGQPRERPAQALKRFDEALAGCDHALKLRPDFAERAL